ncbi:hypothetical protein GCM10027169_35760 [Gordonia jinhuaensis]|uniref:MspA protein n=1 Tax=Gordonia jinhuaensis TaxID=1517702 RepID=A0A916T4W8_9ACTN|nr:hypothetical protein [Gordonia jinhuaensis]GGB29730.1 hypothetical protein GCM10011489_17370 [Gordonia jinhuaensis]
MKISNKFTTRRAATAAVGIAVAAGATVAGVGLANAGTLPVTHPGEPTTAMTITNHTNRYEWLAGATNGGQQWVNAPQEVLAPGASETVVSVAPNSPYMTDFVNYHVGAFGPIATYELENVRGDVNTAMTGMSGYGSGGYWIHANIDSWYPNVNVSYDQW